MRVYYTGIDVATLCQLLGRSRQAYYQGLKSRESSTAFNALIADLVVDIRQSIENNKLGARKLLPLINKELRKEGLSIGRDHLFNIMDAYGLKVRRRKRGTRTTDSSHHFRRYGNLIKALKVKRADQVWVSDITYIKVGDRFMYLSIITDAFSRKIVGYRLHGDLSVEGSLKALLMALSGRSDPSSSLIHHSDQGVQYCSHAYINTLKSNDVSISMASRGSPHENALAERVNGILKQEYELGKVFSSEELAYQSVHSAVNSYNTKRPHNSLGGRTPNQVYHSEVAMDSWKTSQANNGPEVSHKPKATTDSNENPRVNNMSD